MGFREPQTPGIGGLDELTSSEEALIQGLDALAKTDGNFIVGNGTNWVAESGATVRTSLGLGNVENTALSTWAGTTNITTLGTIATGVWNATAIADGKIASALTGKTYNALTLTAAATGFTIAGGTTSKTLTISNTLTLAGTDSSTLNIGTGGTLGTAAYTAATAYESSGAVSTHAALLTGVHGLAITAGKTLTVQDDVTITGALGTGAYATIANYAALAGATFTGNVDARTAIQLNSGYAHATIGNLANVAGTWEFLAVAGQTDYDPKLCSAAGFIYNSTSNDADEMSLGTINLTAGTYKVAYCVRKHSNEGILEVLIGTTSLGTVDLYDAGGPTSNVVGTFTYSPTVPVSALLRVKCSGKNASSSDYFIAISRLEFIKTE